MTFWNLYIDNLNAFIWCRPYLSHW